MASGAQEIAAVIKRFVRQSRVAEIGWRPSDRAMTQTAVLCSIEVTRVLAGCCRTVVAGRTGAKDLVMVHRGCRHPSVGSVAILADIGCGDMCRAFARGVRAVMAAKAIIDDVDVVEIGR